MTFFKNFNNQHLYFWKVKTFQVWVVRRFFDKWAKNRRGVDSTPPPVLIGLTFQFLHVMRVCLETFVSGVSDPYFVKFGSRALHLERRKIYKSYSVTKTGMETLGCLPKSGPETLFCLPKTEPENLFCLLKPGSKPCFIYKKNRVRNLVLFTKNRARKLVFFTINWARNPRLFTKKECYADSIGNFAW